MTTDKKKCISCGEEIQSSEEKYDICDQEVYVHLKDFCISMLIMNSASAMLKKELKSGKSVKDQTEEIFGRWQEKAIYNFFAAQVTFLQNEIEELEKVKQKIEDTKLKHKPIGFL